METVEILNEFTDDGYGRVEDCFMDKEGNFAEEVRDIYTSVLEEDGFDEAEESVYRPWFTLNYGIKQEKDFFGFVNLYANYRSLVKANRLMAAQYYYEHSLGVICNEYARASQEIALPTDGELGVKVSVLLEEIEGLEDEYITDNNSEVLALLITKFQEVFDLVGDLRLDRTVADRMLNSPTGEYIGTQSGVTTDQTTSFANDFDTNMSSSSENLSKNWRRDWAGETENTSEYTETYSQEADSSETKEADSSDERREQSGTNRTTAQGTQMSVNVEAIAKKFKEVCSQYRDDKASNLATMESYLWYSDLIADGLKEMVDGEFIPSLVELGNSELSESDIITCVHFYMGFFDLVNRVSVDFFNKSQEGKNPLLGFSELGFIGGLFSQSNNALRGIDADALLACMHKYIDSSKHWAESDSGSIYTMDDFYADLDDIVEYVLEEKPLKQRDDAVSSILRNKLNDGGYFSTLKGLLLKEFEATFSSIPYTYILRGLPVGTRANILPTSMTSLQVANKFKRIKHSLDEFSENFNGEDCMNFLVAPAKFVSDVSDDDFSVYDADLIVSGYESVPRRILYFPAVHLSYALKRKWVLNSFSSPLAVKSPEEYYAQGIKASLEDFVLDVCEKYLNKVKENKGIEWALVDDNDFNHDDYNQCLVEFLQYLTSCITSLIAVKKFDYKATSDSITEIGFTLIGATGDYCRYEEPAIFRKRQMRSDVNNLENYPKNLNKKFFDVKESIWSLIYAVDEEYVHGKPNFAYKELINLKRQGVLLSWDNVLVGQKLDGTNYIFSKKSAFAKQRLHFVFAGSRSGKGVMTSNLLCTAIASGMPIFYFDRKPDTSTILYGLSGGRMFCVNGGEHNEQFDWNHLLADYFGKEHYVVPQVLEDTNYFPMQATELSDMTYLKGIMLVVEMLYYLSKFRGCRQYKFIQAYESMFGASKTITPIIVLDELSNTLMKMGKSNIYAFDTARCMDRQKINGAFSKDISDNNAKSEKSRKTKDIVIRDFLLKHKKNIVMAYFTAMIDGVTDLFTNVDSGFDAALKGTSVTDVKFFLIGQNLRKVSDQLVSEAELASIVGDLKSGNQQTTVDKRWNTMSNDQEGKNYLFERLFYTYGRSGADYFIGHGGGEYNYLNQNYNERCGDYLSASRRMFAYKAGRLNVATVAEILPDNKNNGMDYSDWCFFKPYLILNDSITPPVIYKDDKYSSDIASIDVEATCELYSQIECAVLESKAVVTPELKQHMEAAGQTGLLLDDRLRTSQYAGQCLYYANKAGINVIDLLYDNRALTMAESSSEDYDDVDTLATEAYCSLQFHSGTGFEGYITKMASFMGVDSNQAKNVLASSGDLMNAYVKCVYGYDGDYMQFLRDYRLTSMPMGFASDQSSLDSEGRILFRERFKKYFEYDDPDLMGALKDTFIQLGLGCLYNGGVQPTTQARTGNGVGNVSFGYNENVNVKPNGTTSTTAGTGYEQKPTSSTVKTAVPTKEEYAKSILKYILPYINLKLKDRRLPSLLLKAGISLAQYKEQFTQRVVDLFYEKTYGGASDD